MIIRTTATGIPASQPQTKTSEDVDDSFDANSHHNANMKSPATQETTT